MFNATFDTSAVYTVRRRSGLAVIILVGMVLYSGFAVFRTIVMPPQDLAGWLRVVGFLFLSAAVIVLLIWFLRRTPRIPLTLSPDGFRYHALGADAVSWPAVVYVELFSMKSLSRLDVWIRAADAPASLAARKGEAVACRIRLSELAVSGHTLERAFAAYRAAHG